MAKRTRVPRVSLGVTILDDPDVIQLLADREGRDAFALFVLLLAVAKAQGTNGVFELPETVMASMCRMSPKDYRAALAALKSRTNWIEVDGSRISIRSFGKWNNNEGWGGKRNGAGKRIKTESRRNHLDSQEGNQVDSRSALSVSVSVSSLPTEEIARVCDSDAEAEAEKAKRREKYEADYENAKRVVEDAFDFDAGSIADADSDDGRSIEARESFARFKAAFPKAYWTHGHATWNAWRGMSPADRELAVTKARVYAQIIAKCQTDAKWVESKNWLVEGCYRDDPEAAWLRKAGLTAESLADRNVARPVATVTPEARARLEARYAAMAKPRGEQSA